MRRDYDSKEERNDRIYNDEEFKKDVLKGYTVKRLMEKYNVSSFRKRNRWK